MSKRNIWYEDDNGDLESTGATAYDLVYPGPPKKIKTLGQGSNITLTDNGTYVSIAATDTGVVSVGSNVAATANSASISGTTLSLAKGSGDYRGVHYGLTDTSLTNIYYGGVKMFAGNNMVVVSPSMDITSGTQDNSIIITNKDATSLPATLASSIWLNTCNIAFTAPTTLSSAVVIGPNACNGGASIAQCVVIGAQAGGSSNSNCVYVGRVAGSNCSGSSNVGIGDQTMYNCTSGFNNVGVGAFCMAGLGFSGSNCTAIGKSSTFSSSTSTRRISLGADASSDANSRFFVDTNVTSFHLTGATAMKVSASFGTGTGTALVIDGSGNIFKQTSSARFKTDIKDIDPSLSENLYLLRPREYTYNCDAPQYKSYDPDCDYCNFTNTGDLEKFGASVVASTERAGGKCPHHLGLPLPIEHGYIAEEVAPLFTKLVNVDEVGPVSVDYARIIIYVVEEMKKLKKRIDEMGK